MYCYKLILYKAEGGYMFGKHRKQSAIVDLKEYIRENYGAGYTESESGTVEPKIQTFLMKDMEKAACNCSIVAMTRILAFYRDNEGKDQIPGNKKLYNDIKSIAAIFGYDMEKGTNPVKINNILNYMLTKYGYSGKGKSTYILNFKTVKEQIDAGRPLILNIAFGYYRDHTVSVVGYNEFSKGTGRFKKKKRFIKVYDGWTDKNTYIDYDRINIASFSKVKFDS